MLRENLPSALEAEYLVVVANRPAKDRGRRPPEALLGRFESAGLASSWTSPQGLVTKD